jgi:hypothetical protein
VVVSAFDDLSEEQKIEAIRRLSGASLALNMNTFTILANRGLLRPEEVDGTLSTLVELIDKLPESLRAEISPGVMEKLEAVRREAASNWSGQ